ncbi:arf-GAP with Rho-GAP domain, ANK repeat and PH domain-containing protein 2 [Lampris incognitus]|uniref:arf-GAP with Rho-GAP domain, ANK repeat and PH domain-containing protein 2 n=1 Tax=Lampris incognitus TaxID=2546036 RepID=UPI0024B4DAE6|nr:arf-GAP with Rho-GAP domain, ANK repeat and PH domain-containing protein 2 [Lampris incognitus]
MEPPEPSQEILDWLTTLHLPQYALCFQSAGYKTLEECKDLTDECLLALTVYPTGHRRRILRSLEALGVGQECVEEEEEEEEEGVGREKGRGQRKPMPYPRHIFLKDKKRATSCQNHEPKERRYYDTDASQSLPPGAGLGAEIEVVAESGTTDPPRPALRDPRNIHNRSFASTSMTNSRSSSSSDSLSSHSEVPSDWEISSEEPPLSGMDSIPPPAEVSSPVLTGDQGGFLGEMVENTIYERGPSFKARKGPRPTRSYRLRHRPVPEIPNQTILSPEAPAQTASPQHLPGSEGPSGANSIQKAPLQRTLTPIAPYGETFLYNNPEDTSDQGTKGLVKKELKDKIKKAKPRKKPSKHKNLGKRSQKDGTIDTRPTSNASDLCEDEYSMVDEHVASLQMTSQGLAKAATANPELLSVSPTASGAAATAHHGGSIKMVECDLGLVRNTVPLTSDISPYACFYGAPKHKLLKAGWLDKLSPQGNCVFQRRWVRFDGESLTYYNNDKDMYSKGMVLASAFKQVRGLGDNKFEVVTSLRTFIFRAEREGERQEWMETLQTAVHLPVHGSQKPTSSSTPPSSTNKRSSLELRGYKGRVLVSLAGCKVRLCKTEQDYKAGLAIAEVDLTAANIKDVDRRGFEINTPFKNFCFTAESEREKEEWIEAVQESIAETLSDYEVAEKIWFNEANRSCADCHAPRPEWASVNLGVVICKKCAGQHRSLGPSISKVRSLKLDSSIWSNELVELFLEVGNKNANSFWASSLPLEEELHMGSSTEQRATFLRRKYRERKYRRVLEGFHDQEQLNQALCAAVVLPDVVQTMALVFSGADVMCATGDPEYSTPYLLAQRAGQMLQMEFLHQNKLSDFPKLEQWPENSSPSDALPFMDGFLYVSSGPAKTTTERRGKDDMVRRWCTLEGGFLSYYESERSPVAISRVDVTEVVTLALCNTETMTGAGAVFTVELYLHTERVLMVGAETQDTQQDWLRALAKCFVPSKVEGMLRGCSELIGRLHYKEGHDLYHWRIGWFALEGSSLHYIPGEGDTTEEVIQLKQLQELTVSTHTEGEDKIQVLLMVEGGSRTVYIHAFNKLDFALWHSAIKLAARTDGRALGNQQLSKNGVPIVVDSCIAFVTQYGLCQEGVYQREGDANRVALLWEEFSQDARNVKLREKEHRLEDVTDTLKCFLSQAEDALLTKELYPYWVSALDEEDEKRRVEKYSTFIHSLPKINRSTLEALLQHLYRIHQCSHLNQMPSQRLASVFSSCLFQTRGQTPQEISVVRDLINNYVTLFRVNEDQVQQMERENRFITRWNDKKDTTFSPAGDLIFEVYLEKREPENCCLIKLSPNMTATDLTESALMLKNVPISPDDLWTTFEVIENGELERPLHQKENILEQVLGWSSLDDPGSAHLVIKKFTGAKMVAAHKGPKQFLKGDYLKFKDGPSKLLSGHKFQDKYVMLQGDKLLLYRDIKSTKAEKEVLLRSAKCYLGLRRKLKPPTSFHGWGFTVYTDKQQWTHCQFCELSKPVFSICRLFYCEEKDAQIDWVTAIIRMKYGCDLWTKSVNSGQSAVHSTSRGGAVADGHRGSQPSKHKDIKQPAKKGVSLGDANPRMSQDANLYLTTGTLPNPLKSKDKAAPRRASVGVCRPNLPASSSSSTALPAAKSLAVPPRSAAKSPNRRPVPGGEAMMPPSLLNELNSVLNRTGRSTKDDNS